MWHVWGRGEVPTGLWCGNVGEGNNFDYLRVDGRIILKQIFKTSIGNA
jgi:hypothetical protein